MQGFYYINLPLKIHDMKLSLNQTSVLRIYTEPHDIDVDIWLYHFFFLLCVYAQLFEYY